MMRISLKSWLLGSSHSPYNQTRPDQFHRGGAHVCPETPVCLSLSRKSVYLLTYNTKIPCKLYSLDCYVDKFLKKPVVKKESQLVLVHLRTTVPVRNYFLSMWILLPVDKGNYGWGDICQNEYANHAAWQPIFTSPLGTTTLTVL